MANHFIVDTKEECVALGSVTLYSNNQENCVYGDVSVPIGDELHLPCENGEVGVRVMKCNETKDGAVFTVLETIAREAENWSRAGAFYHGRNGSEV